MRISACFHKVITQNGLIIPYLPRSKVRFHPYLLGFWMKARHKSANESGVRIVLGPKRRS